MEQSTPDREKMAEMRAVTEITREVQKRAIDNVNPPVKTGKALLGDAYTPHNAVMLAEKLYENGYEPLLVWGQIVTDERREIYDTNPDEFTVQDAEDHNDTHYWVEIPRENDEPLVCDIACESRTGVEPGDMIVQSGRPPEYRTPPESVFKFDPRMEAVGLGSYHRYEKFCARFNPIA